MPGIEMVAQGEAAWSDPSKGLRWSTIEGHRPASSKGLRWSSMPSMPPSIVPRWEAKDCLLDLRCKLTETGTSELSIARSAAANDGPLVPWGKGNPSCEVLWWADLAIDGAVAVYGDIAPGSLSWMFPASWRLDLKSSLTSETDATKWELLASRAGDRKRVIPLMGGNPTRDFGCSLGDGLLSFPLINFERSKSLSEVFG